jgi:PKD repeat protein
MRSFLIITICFFYNAIFAQSLTELRSLNQRMGNFSSYLPQVGTNRSVCEAGFVSYVTAEFENGLSFPVAFSNLSTVMDYENAQYSWDFGDGGVSTDAAPIYVYTSYNPYYIACLTVTDGACTSTFCDTVDLASVYNQSPCSLNFIWTHSATQSNTIHVMPTYLGNFVYEWNFGDGTYLTTNATTATHTYDTVGIYTVCVNAVDTVNDCSMATCQFVHAELLNAVSNGPMQINQLPNVEQSIQNILFGSCVEVSNISFNGASNAAIGYFSDSTAAIGFDYGLLLTTGDIMNAVGPNTNTGAGTNLGMPGDPMLDMLIPGYISYDAVSINFEFTPQADTLIACEFVFASEEYPEFVGSAFNDVFGFFINGPGTNGWQNIAWIPGTNVPVSINQVNQMSFPQYYINNTPGLLLQYDAFTAPIALEFPVQANQTYQFRIVIGDAGDGVFDSGVFIKGGSFLGNTPLPAARFAFSGLGTSVEFENQSEHVENFTWNFGDGSTSTEVNPTHTYTQTGFYNVRLEGSNVCYLCDTTQTLAVTPGEVLNVTGPFNSGVQLLQNGMIRINFALERPSDLGVDVLSASGELVRKTTFNNVQLGSEEISLDGLAKGIYLLRLKAFDQDVLYKVIH